MTSLLCSVSNMQQNKCFIFDYNKQDVHLKNRSAIEFKSRQNLFIVLRIACFVLIL